MVLGNKDGTSKVIYQLPSSVMVLEEIAELRKAAEVLDAKMEKFVMGIAT